MKKLILIFSIIPIIVFFSNDSIIAKWSVNIFATVWETNNIPRISDIIPDYNPTIVYLWESMIFNFQVTDIENELLFYTISTDDWVIDNVSWTINWSWNISFFYQSPNYFPQNWTPNEWLTKIYITVNDWINFVVKEINIYIF